MIATSGKRDSVAKEKKEHMELSVLCLGQMAT
jgi:hypothetical protein